MNLEEVHKTFTDWAPIYNATHTWTLPKRREARLALGVQPGDRVLNLAYGIGINFPHLRSLAGEQRCVVGVDLTPAILETASRRVAMRGWINADVHEADATRPPFPNESFDKAISTFALNIIPKYMHTIEEIRRVLVPGGRFVSLEFRTAFHALPHWLAPFPRTCAMDVTHKALDEMKRVFGAVQVRGDWFRSIFVAITTKW